jgi:hypothetical protein
LWFLSDATGFLDTDNMCNWVTVSGFSFLRTFEAATHKHVWWLRIQKIFTGARGV